MFEKVTADKAVAALSKFGGEVIKTSLSDETTAEIQKELHGESHRFLRFRWDVQDNLV